MNSLKKPETVITLINTAALLGASIYFYKKTNNLELELNKHSEHLTLTVKKVKEIANTKKHIAVLADAIKKVNYSLGSQDNEVETLKEIVKYQNSQIIELQKFILEMRDEENKNEFKLKENHHIQNILYRSNYQQGTPQRIQQPQNFQGQGFQQPQQQSQNFRQPQQPQNFRQPQQFQQQFQQQQPQQFQQPQNYRQLPPRNDSLIDLEFSQRNQGHPQQNYPQQNFQQQNYPQQNFQQPGFSQSYDDDGIDDEDAAIDAVRRARQQQNDPLDGLL